MGKEKNINEVTEEKKVSESDVITLLLKKIEKPKNCIKIKAANVYGNRYRVNIWTVTHEDGLDRNKISQSYFVSVSENEVVIL